MGCCRWNRQVKSDFENGVLKKEIASKDKIRVNENARNVFNDLTPYYFRMNSILFNTSFFY